MTQEVGTCESQRYSGTQVALGDHLEDDLEFSEYCTLGKSHKVKFNTGQHTTRSKLDYIHMTNKESFTCRCSVSLGHSG